MRLLLILRSYPYQSMRVQEGLDLALMLAAMGHSLSIVLEGSAVWLLQPGQNAQLSHRRNLYQLLQSLPLYDIQQCYVRRQGCPLEEIKLGSLWQWLEESAWYSLLQANDEVLYW